MKQELLHKHREAQQCCQPHNLPLLKATQQRELEVRPLSSLGAPAGGGGGSGLGWGDSSQLVLLF